VAVLLTLAVAIEPAIGERVAVRLVGVEPAHDGTDPATRIDTNGTRQTEHLAVIVPVFGL
jgi:hypothetical protein